MFPPRATDSASATQRRVDETVRVGDVRRLGSLDALVGRSGIEAPRRSDGVTAECPECGGTITFKSPPMLHELVRCPDCGGELAVMSIEPIDVQLAPTEAEDWGE